MGPEHRPEAVRAVHHEPAGGTTHGDTNALIVTGLTIAATLTSLYDLLLVLTLSGR